MGLFDWVWSMFGGSENDQEVEFEGDIERKVEEMESMEASDSDDSWLK